MKLWIAILSLTLAGTCAAAPKKAEAENWLTQFKQFHWKATDALVLRDAVGQARGTMRKSLLELEAKADRVFGKDMKFDTCKKSAERLTMLFDDTFFAVREGGYNNTSNVARNGIEMGYLWSECTNAIEALK